MSWRDVLENKPAERSPQIPESPEFGERGISGDIGISGGAIPGLLSPPAAGVPEAPILAEDEARDILAWLGGIGETDPELIADTLTRCARNPAARAYFLGRAREFADPPPTADAPPEPQEAPSRLVRCAECGHWTADTINPPGGLGACAAIAAKDLQPNAAWPWSEIVCRRWRAVADWEQST